MSKDQPATTAAFDPLLGLTGRDGAIDHAARNQALDGSDPDEGFALALGRAVVDTWAQLARADQERIFESAVVMGHQSGRDESFREQLARYLHDRHERTVSTGT